LASVNGSNLANLALKAFSADAQVKFFLNYVREKGGLRFVLRLCTIFE
jgi:hypothetical protein